MGANWNERLDAIQGSLIYFLPELALVVLFVALIIASFVTQKQRTLLMITAAGHLVSLVLGLVQDLSDHVILFDGMLRHDGLATWLKVLVDAGVVFTCLLTTARPQVRPGEYFAVLTGVAIGAHLLVMCNNFLMIFIALEVVSIGSYVLAGFAFNKQGSEGSMKYFLFGATASAVMLYGFSLLYGLSGTLRMDDPHLTETLASGTSPLVLVSGLMVIAGFLFKISATPMHFWAPDVYAGAPTPVVAFFSVVPKLAGLGVLVRFALTLNSFGEPAFDWQSILALVSLLTITIGNVAALKQTDPKRMMAYSSIAHSGFLLVGLVPFSPQGIHYMLFYAVVYLVMNFTVFAVLLFFEEQNIHTIPGFAGAARSFVWASVLLLIGFVSLTGLPPTAGFTAKLFVFSALWESYGIAGKPLYLWLLVLGLINTVISLFYYFRIPYYSFLRTLQPAIPKANLQAGFLHFLAFLLVIILLALFFAPGLLMGWINKITFVS